MKSLKSTLLPLSASLWAIAAVGSAGTAVAQDARHEAQKYDQARGTLPNGLQYLVERRPGEPLVVALIIRTGYRVERPEEAGLSHLIEHRAFAKTEHFDIGKLRRYLKYRFGGTITGVTTPVDTRLIMTLAENSGGSVPQLMQVVHDWARGIILDETSLSKEGRVQLDELRNGNSYFAERKFLDRILGENAAAYEVQVEKNLHGFKPKIAKAYYDRWYRPELMSLIIVGDCDPQLWESNIAQTLGGLHNPVQDALPYTPLPLTVRPGERVFTVEDLPSAPITVRTLTASAAPSEEGSTRSQRDDVLATLAMDVVIKRAGEFSPNDIMLEPGDGSNIFVPGVHTGLYLLSRSTFENVERAAAVHDAFIRNLLSNKITPAEMRSARNSVRDFYSPVPDNSTAIVSYYTRFFGVGAAPQPYIDRPGVVGFVDDIKLEEVQKFVDRLVKGAPRTGISGPKAVLSKIDIQKVERAIGSYTPPARMATDAPTEPKERAAPQISSNEPLRARLPLISTYQTILPGGLQLTMANPDVVNTEATSLWILGDCKGPEIVDLQTVNFDVSKAMKPTAALIGALAAKTVKGQLSCSKGNFTLALDARSNRASEQFELASLLVRDRSVVRPADQAAPTGEAEGANVASLWASDWTPRRLLFVGSRPTSEVEAIAWRNFVSSTVDSPSPCNGKAGEPAVISSSLRSVTTEKQIKSTLEVDVAEAGFRSSCWDILRDMFTDRLYYDLRLDKAVTYQPRYQFSSSVEGDVRRIRFDFAVDRDDVAGPRKLAGWTAFVSNLPENLLRRDQFEISRLAVARRDLAAPDSSQEMAAFLQDVLTGNREKSDIEPFGAEQLKFEDIGALVNDVASAMRRKTAT